MKIAFTTTGENLDAPLEPRCGRSPRLLIYDQTDGSFEIIDNRQSVDAAHGAGIQTAERVIRSGARAVVTGHCGPKVFRALSAAGVALFMTDISPVSAALQAFEAGRLEPASEDKITS